MIDRDEMMAQLLGACPSFAPDWRRFLKKWQGDPHGLPLAIALGELARHLIGLLERGDEERLKEVFAVIERSQVDGDAGVKSSSRGLLEQLHKTRFHEKTRPEQFRGYLGPVSRRSWDAWDQFREVCASDPARKRAQTSAWGLGFWFPWPGKAFDDVAIHLPWEEVGAVGAHAGAHPQTGQSLVTVTFYGPSSAVGVDAGLEGWEALLDDLPARLPLAPPDWRARLDALRPAEPPLLLFQRDAELPEWVKCLGGFMTAS
jgi:hypothetical protein